MHIQLADQVAIVTGSAHRVGKAIALELAKHGVHILVHYHQSSEDVVKTTVREIKSHGVDAFAVQADVSTAEGVQAIFQAVRDHFSHLDILVNSASNFQRRTLMDVTLDEWQETLATNLTGPFLCTQEAAKMMQDNHPSGGAIINICDKGAIDPWPEFAHHGISKAGLLALTKVTAASLGPDIRANAIVPGVVLKPAGMDEDRWQRNAQRIPAQVPGTAEDVARAVVYLASESFISGTVLHVDGGESVI